MKLIRWATENYKKRIVIITKTVAQADNICKEIKLNIRTENGIGNTIHSYSPATREEVRLDNETIISIAPEHSCVTRFKGTTIDVLLFCENMGTNTINFVTRYLIQQMGPERIIGVFKI